MGLKHSKGRELFKDSVPLSVNVELPSKPYRFINANDMKSYSVPTLVKFLSNPTRAEQLDRQATGSTSVAFLSNERYLIFGSICTELDTYAIERRLYNQGISQHDNLSLVDLQLNQTQVLINRPVRDICLSSACEHLAFLTYSGYSRLQVCPCNETPRLDDIQIFEEKNLISHSTCCAFSPDGKWLVIGVCSDYFTMRSRSHLVIRPVNLQVGKFGKSKEIDFAGQHLQKNLPIGLLISLEFSSDSTLLAVGGSQNNLFLLSTKAWELLSVIGKPSDRFTSLWGLFHPSCDHRELISCTGFGRLEKWELQVHNKNLKPAMANDKPYDAMDISDELHTTVPCCPSFAPNGNMLAVGFSNGKVVIVDPNQFETLWVISPEFVHIDHDLHASTKSASSLCFSKSCGYLAIGYSDHLVTVWLLPRNSFTLKHFCRTVILTVCPAKMVPKLPIPNSLKQYLLYQA